jgi:hypothetical protein
MKLVLRKRNELQQHTGESKKEKKILYWTDTMMPGFKSDHPGLSPMGMQMTPVYEKEQSQGTVNIPGYTTISVPLQKQQLIGLRTAIIGKTNAVKTIRAAGHVSTNNDLYKFQDEYVQAYMQFEMVYRDYHRFEHTRRNWEPHRELQIKLHEVEDKLLRLGLGEDQIRQLQKYSWQTPWDQPDLLFLKDNYEYWVVAQIFEGDLDFVHVGQDAEIEIPSYKERVKGIIRSIGGTVDPDTRTTNVLIELKDYQGEELKGNMFVNVAISARFNQVIIVPREAVMDTGVRKIVFVQKDEGTFEPRDIQTGLEVDDGYEVTSGLKTGERIVLSGNFLLDSESRLQASLEEATQAGTTTAAEGDSHGQ